MKTLADGELMKSPAVGGLMRKTEREDGKIEVM